MDLNIIESDILSLFKKSDVNPLILPLSIRYYGVTTKLIVEVDILQCPIKYEITLKDISTKELTGNLIIDESNMIEVVMETLIRKSIIKW